MAGSWDVYAGVQRSVELATIASSPVPDLFNVGGNVLGTRLPFMHNM